RVDPGQQVLLVEQVAFDALVDGGDQDAQVLLDIRVLLGGQGALVLAADGGDGLAVALVDAGPHVVDHAVEAGDDEKAGELGRERRLGVQQLLGQRIAAFVPGRGGGRGGGGGAGRGHGGGLVGRGGAHEGKGQGKAAQATLHG